MNMHHHDGSSPSRSRMLPYFEAMQNDFSISRSTAVRLVRAGSVRTVLGPGSKRLIDRAELDRFRASVAGEAA